MALALHTACRGGQQSSSRPPPRPPLQTLIRRGVGEELRPRWGHSGHSRGGASMARGPRMTVGRDGMATKAGRATWQRPRWKGAWRGGSRGCRTVMLLGGQRQARPLDLKFPRVKRSRAGVRWAENCCCRVPALDGDPPPETPPARSTAGFSSENAQSQTRRSPRRAKPREKSQALWVAPPWWGVGGWAGVTSGRFNEKTSQLL